VRKENENLYLIQGNITRPTPSHRSSG